MIKVLAFVRGFVRFKKVATTSHTTVRRNYVPYSGIVIWTVVRSLEDLQSPG
jgi:hypothetical protein